MKYSYILFGLLLMIIVTSCNQPPAPQQKTIQYYDDYDIISVGGCEYIRFGAGDFSWGGHKGDCKNPIHQYNKIDTSKIISIDGIKYKVIPATDSTSVQITAIK